MVEGFGSRRVGTGRMQEGSEKEQAYRIIRFDKVYTSHNDDAPRICAGGVWYTSHVAK